MLGKDMLPSLGKSLLRGGGGATTSLRADTQDPAPDFCPGGKNLMETWVGDSPSGGLNLLDQFESYNGLELIATDETDSPAAAAAASRVLNTPTMSNMMNTPVVCDFSFDLAADAEDFKKEFFEMPVDAASASSGSFDEVWDLALPTVEEPLPPLATSVMTCVNPMDVEGMELPPAEALPVVDVLSASPTAVVKTKKSNPKQLRLIMPKPAASMATVLATPPLCDDGFTPAIEKSLKKNSDASIDLLAYITDSTIKIDDPSVLAFIGSSSPLPDLASTISFEDIAASPAPPKGKRRQKAKKTKTVVKKEEPQPGPSRGRRVRPRASSTVTSQAASAIDHSYMHNIRVKEEEGSCDEARYRRMRDLNNVASKRCRQNRKRKMGELLENEEDLMVRNGELKVRCQHLEDLVEKLKKEFIVKVANPKRKPLDLDKLMAERLSGV